MNKKLIPSLFALILSSPEFVFASPESTIALDSVVIIINKSDAQKDASLAGSVNLITRDELVYELVTETLFSKQ